MSHSALRGAVAAVAALATLSLAASAAPQEKSGQDPERQGKPRVRRSESLQKIRTALDNWGAKSWDDILADDVRLTLKTADVSRSGSGDVSMVSLNRQVTGKEAVKKALNDINKNLRTETTITSEMISGDEAVLLGEVTVAGQERSGVKPKGEGVPQESREQGREGRKDDRSSEQGKESQQGTPSKSVPVAIHLHFDESDKVDRMVISTMNLRSMREGGGAKESKELQQK